MTVKGYKRYFRCYQGQLVHEDQLSRCPWHHLEKDAKSDGKYEIHTNDVISETVVGQMDKPDNYTWNYIICQKTLQRKYMQITSFFNKNLRLDLAI